MRIAFVGDSLTAGIPGSSYLEVLRRRLPGDTLLNLGLPNDTVVSLHRRITRPLPRSILRHLLAEPVDMGFLWIGINDVGKHPSWFHKAYANLLGQRQAGHVHEFRSCYREMLVHMGRAAGQVVAVAPLLEGEDLDSPLNHRVQEYARVVEELVREDGRAWYLDLRPVFAARLAGRPISTFLPRRPRDVLWDALTLRTDAQIDRRSRQRGLHLTLDGLHMNSAGAALVAESLAEVIARFAAGSPASAARSPGPDR